MYDAWKVSPKIGLSGFRNVFATGKLANVAVINNFILSIKSVVYEAMAMYIGNKQVPAKAVCNALLGIIALIGNDTVVRLKSPEIIFLPTSEMINFPTLLVAFVTALSKHCLPPLS